MNLLVSFVALAGIAYMAMLVRWWPVLDDPEHFNRIDQDHKDLVSWARSLVLVTTDG